MCFTNVLGLVILFLEILILARALVLWLRYRNHYGRQAWIPKWLVAGKGVQVTALIISSLLMVDCTTCRVSDYGFGFLTYYIEQGLDEIGKRTIVTETLWLSIETLPVFFLGSFAAGAMSKAFEKGRFKPPRSMLGAALLGSILPLCSCGAAPIARSLLSDKKGARAALAFLLVAPVISPTVLVMSLGVLGWSYTVARISGTFVLAFLLAPILAGLAVKEKNGTMEWIRGAGCSGQAGCHFKDKLGDGATYYQSRESWLEAGWAQALELHPYILVGILGGAVVSVYLPEDWIMGYFSNPLWGLAAASAMGIPVYMCTGEEIPLLQPLMDMGLPMGHAIAFTISGNAVCIASYAILVPLFGKRTAFGVMLGLFVGSFLLGLAINLL